jgi:hypothetical protein
VSGSAMKSGFATVVAGASGSPSRPTSHPNSSRPFGPATPPYVVLTPYPGRPAPVAGSAWGAQFRPRSADDSSLNEVAQARRHGPQTPELGAACIDGIGPPAP